jgi:hypothetical protein
MNGLAPAASVGPALSAVQFQAQYQAAALNMQKQAIQDAGAAALRLITTALTATADPGVGRNLDVAA